MSALSDLLGLQLEARDLSLLQVSLRGIIVFFATLIIVRVANKRFLAKLTAFDFIVGFILASMMARAVNGSGPFWSTLGGGLVLVMVHRLLAVLSYHWEWFGILVKGTSDPLVRDGQIDKAKLRHYRVSEKDLEEEARLNGGLERLERVKLATLERNGKISIVEKD